MNTSPLYVFFGRKPNRNFTENLLTLLPCIANPNRLNHLYRYSSEGIRTEQQKEQVNSATCSFPQNDLLRHSHHCTPRRSITQNRQAATRQVSNCGRLRQEIANISTGSLKPGSVKPCFQHAQLNNSKIAMQNSLRTTTRRRHHD